MEYRGAAGVPMAVPCSWRQNVSPNVKILLDMTISKVARNRDEGKLGGIRFELVLMRLRIASTPYSRVMFVYIAVASAVKSLAPLGIVRDFSSFSRSLESFM